MQISRSVAEESCVTLVAVDSAPDSGTHIHTVLWVKWLIEELLKYFLIFSNEGSFENQVQGDLWRPIFNLSWLRNTHTHNYLREPISWGASVLVTFGFSFGNHIKELHKECVTLPRNTHTHNFLIGLLNWGASVR